MFLNEYLIVVTVFGVSVTDVKYEGYLYCIIDHKKVTYAKLISTVICNLEIDEKRLNADTLLKVIQC